jgi:hypothetical protein
MHLRTCGRVKSGHHKKLGPQITIPQSATFSEAASPRSCGFAICGIYLWTTHLCIVFYITFTVNMCKTNNFFLYRNIGDLLVDRGHNVTQIRYAQTNTQYNLDTRYYMSAYSREREWGN